MDHTSAQLEALHRAETGQSVANYEAIFDGFMKMGIEEKDINPRENVFTFNAWIAKGRVVKKGEHGVKIITFISGSRKDQGDGEERSYRIPKRTTVFHISQTKPADGAQEEE